jgi:hypothetical protein
MEKIFVLRRKSLVGLRPGLENIFPCDNGHNLSFVHRRPSLSAGLVFAVSIIAVEELLPKLAIRGPFPRLFAVLENFRQN